MARIGKLPVATDGVEVSIDGRTVTAKGSKGELSVRVLDYVNVEKTEEGVQFSPADDSKKAHANWGTSRALVQNIVTGVRDGFQRKLVISGVGYRAQMQGSNLKLSLGLSHDVVYEAPDGIQLQAPQPTEVVITGIDRQLVGQVAANIREFRPPEPYKGKGIRYEDERIIRKEGKKK